MDILKLAAEMDLNCIKAYKLDALKSVRKTNEAKYIGKAGSRTDAIVTLAEDSEPCINKVDAGTTNASEDSSTRSVVQTGKGHANLYPFLFIFYYLIL